VNIDYLENGSDDCPIIRVYGNEPDSVRLLMKCIADMVNGEIKSKCLNDIKGFKSINGCRFDIELSSLQKGVIQLSSNNFICQLSKDGWQEAYELLEPLSEDSKTGYQWINESSEISFLVSRYANGQW
jgi:hypothetical protein